MGRAAQEVVDGVVEVVVHVVVAPEGCQWRRKDGTNESTVPSRAVFELELVLVSPTRF
jgi:hypothetical protein